MLALNQEPGEGQGGLSGRDEGGSFKENHELHLEKVVWRRRDLRGLLRVGRAVRAAEGRERGILGEVGSKSTGPETRAG